MLHGRVDCLNKNCPSSKGGTCALSHPRCVDRIKGEIEHKQIIRKDGLTEQEGKVMDSLVDAWNEFTKLEKTHPSETNDFMNGIHQCQNTLCMRILRRDYPEGYSTYN